MPITLKEANKLARMIRRYADLQEADSWSGGGDPDLVEPIRKKLERHTLKLGQYLASLTAFPEKK
jgi:hypothetical protein